MIPNKKINMMPDPDGDVLFSPIFSLADALPEVRSLHTKRILQHSHSLFRFFFFFSLLISLSFFFFYLFLLLSFSFFQVHRIHEIDAGRPPPPLTQPWISPRHRQDQAPYYTPHTYGSYWHKWYTRAYVTRRKPFDVRTVADE